MNFSEIDNALHCSFPGRLDGLTCSNIEHELLCRVTKFKGNRTNVRLIFDLNGVVYISSLFLRICLMHFKTFGKNNFSVRNVSDEILKVFRISGFAEIMDVIPAEEAA